MRIECLLVASTLSKVTFCRRQNIALQLQIARSLDHTNETKLESSDASVVAVDFVNASHESHIAFDSKASSAVHSLSKPRANLASNSDSTLVSVPTSIGNDTHAPNSSSFVDIGVKRDGHSAAKNASSLTFTPFFEAISQSTWYGLAIGVLLGWCCCCFVFQGMLQQGSPEDGDEGLLSRDAASFFSMAAGRESENEPESPPPGADRSWSTGKKIKKNFRRTLRMS